ncbi:MAG: hypothetical protein IPJ13_05030 [Saprospiraceae bacterium]|nr:hypothetical protein [Saprospiraceae bacterium]
MTKATIPEICSNVGEDIENISKLKSFYEIEKPLDEVWPEVGSKVLESTIGSVPLDPRKNKGSKQNLERLK